jgi:hypothetical protein
VQANDVRGPLRRVIHRAALGLFSALLALAIGLSIVSFLTACKCMEPFVPKSSP